MPLHPFQVEISTPRLLLRPWRKEDAPVLRESLDYSDAHLRPFIPFMKDEPRSLDETRSRVLGFAKQFEDAEQFRFAVFSDQVFVGEVMFLDRELKQNYELGFWLDRRHLRQGYTFEACAALLQMHFERTENLSCFLQCLDSNHGSQAVAKSLGFLFLEEKSLQGEAGDAVQTLQTWLIDSRAYGASKAKSLRTQFRLVY